MNTIQLITAIANDLGFPLVHFLNRRDAQFGDWIAPWLEKEFHADMEWIANNRPIRQDPCSIEETGESLIILAFPYFTEPPKEWNGQHRISNYSWGEDYHQVLRKKLKTMIQQLREKVPDFQGRGFVDSAPIPEKIVAAQSGMGWIGKNSLLINRTYGSWLFLAEIVCNLDLPSSEPIKDRCGTCTKCIDACPTGAIHPEKMVDSRKCISYLTIEKRGEFSDEEKEGFDYQLFGCDICQQVCPWNRKVQFEQNSPFRCFDRWKSLTADKAALLTDQEFETLKVKSPVKRAKAEGLRRNALAVLERS